MFSLLLLLLVVLSLLLLLLLLVVSRGRRRRRGIWRLFLLGAHHRVRSHVAVVSRPVFLIRGTLSANRSLTDYSTTTTNEGELLVFLLLSLPLTLWRRSLVSIYLTGGAAREVRHRGARFGEREPVERGTNRKSGSIFNEELARARP